MTTKSDLNLTEIAARWLRLEYRIRDHICGGDTPKLIDIKDGDNWYIFSPLHDLNDLDKVVVRLLDYQFQLEIWKCPIKGKLFNIHRYKKSEAPHYLKKVTYKEGSYPSDYASAILELVAEIAKDDTTYFNVREEKG